MYLLKGFQLFIHFSSVLKQLPGDKDLHLKTEGFTQKLNLHIEINQ